MAKTFNTVDQFLTHQPGIERRGGKYMRSWKKNGNYPGGGAIAVWHSTVQLPVSVWMHQFPRLVVNEDKQTRAVTKNYYMSDFVCWEDEETLRRMYQRDASGLREFPPQRCPICLLLEMLYQAIADKDISSFDEVFRFEGATDPTKNIVLHAGGMLNLWRPEKMTDPDKQEMAARGLYFSSAWKENCQAKNNYVFTLVQQDDQGAGLQIDTEPGILGDKVRSMINDDIASRGQVGNPFTHPYCIEFVYDNTKTDFKEKYRARRIERHLLTESLKQLIYGEAPNLSHVTGAFNGQSMRAVMEKHRMLDVPWDDLFAAPQPEGGAEEFAHGANAPAQASPLALTGHGGTVAGLEQCTTAGCKYMLRPDETRCPECGTEYDPVETAAPQPVPQPAGYQPAGQQYYPPVAPPPPVASPAASPPAAMRSIGKTRGGQPKGDAPRKPGDPY